MERVMSELATYFSLKSNVEIHLVLYGRKPEIFYPISSKVIIHTPDFVFDNSKRFLYTIKTLCFLRKKIKILEPDSIISFGEYWNSFVLFALFGLNYPVYVSDRCQPNKDLGKVHNNLRKWLYPRARGIIAQTLKAGEIYQYQFRHSNIKIIGNPIINTNEFIDPGSKENIVLTIGRLIKTKNHDKLIEIFVKINKSGWKLIIVGEDSQNQKIKSKLLALINKLNAQDKVELAGKQKDVGHYYGKSKIFAFASSSEGFPNVIGEAQSYGLPVIAFDCIAGPSEMITDGINGFLIPMSDYNLFESKLRLLMEDEELRHSLGRKAQETIKKYDIESVCEKYYSFLLDNYNLSH
jgi:GalNAc-alpha-(1->4)-GalNAc-alpha-(1->3)-diNAcBac-PP-undecaprenol alpha-1,4-N-acetyl-D-galactosaminyltransferase